MLYANSDYAGNDWLVWILLALVITSPVWLWIAAAMWSDGGPIPSAGEAQAIQDAPPKVAVKTVEEHFADLAAAYHDDEPDEPLEDGDDTDDEDANPPAAPAAEVPMTPFAIWDRDEQKADALTYQALGGPPTEDSIAWRWDYGSKTSGWAVLDRKPVSA